MCSCVGISDGFQGPDSMICPSKSDTQVPKFTSKFKIKQIAYIKISINK